MLRVYNGSTFDLLHTGHLYVLRQMRELAGVSGEVIIGLNTDEFVEQFKGHKPVQPYAERAEIIAAIRYVDRVVPNVGGADSRVVLEAVMPDIIAVGYDWWSPDDSKYFRQMGFDQSWLDDHGMSLVYLRWLSGRSSTKLRGIARDTPVNDHLTEQQREAFAARA